MSRKQRKTIITCAITGAIHTPTMSDALPFRPQDIAEQSVAAAEAGASVLHLHARNPENGSVSIDPEHFKRFLPVIKQATDAVINVSTGGSLLNTMEERIAPARWASPEMCSLNMGSMNFSMHPLADRYDEWKFDWEEDYLRNSDGYIFRNTFADIAYVAEQLGQGHGVKFEHECYDVGHLYNLKFCMDSGLFKPPVFIQFIFGILGGIGPRSRQPHLHETNRGPAVRRRLSVVGPWRRWGADAIRHDGNPARRQCPRWAGGQPDDWPWQAGQLECRTGQQDPPDRRGTRL